MFLSAHKTFMSSTGRSARRFVASFVFAAASGLVLLATAQHVESTMAEDAAVAAEEMRPSPEYLAARAQLDAMAREEEAAAEGEASAQ
jgi:hypothetical protein